MTKAYRKEHVRVWKRHHGAIPKDPSGRSFEIHHVDGNPENNCIDNLICVSIGDHYQIHLAQGDYGAAFLIANRMQVKPCDIANVARLASLKRVQNGTHNFQNPQHPRSLDHNKGKVVAKNLVTGEIKQVPKEEFDASDVLVGHNCGRKQKVVHNNRGHNKGKSWTQQHKEIPSHVCSYCGFTGRGSSVSRWHNENCKHKDKENGSKIS